MVAMASLKFLPENIFPKFQGYLLWYFHRLIMLLISLKGNFWQAMGNIIRRQNLFLQG